VRVQNKILLVEDDPFLRSGLNELMGQAGYATQACTSVLEARRHVENSVYDLIILDIGLPDGDGIGLCKAWRLTGCKTPVLFLTACDEEIQVVRGFDAGGDDYVTKPFRMLELLSRIRALLRRSAPAMFVCSGLEIDTERMIVRKNGEAVFLTPIEFRLLTLILRASGRVMTRDKLLENIWDMGGQFIDGNTLSVHISRLREKIGAEFIRTVRGVGYQWEDTL
jgi:two-component system, OmpR family, response regulator RegX3